MPASRSHKKPNSIDDATLEQWLSESLNPQAHPRRQRLDAQAQAILALVDHVRDTLVPIQPSPHFVHELGQALIQTATRGQQSLMQRYRKAIWIGAAAAGSLASVVGLTAYLLRQRGRRHARGLLKG